LLIDSVARVYAQSDATQTEFALQSSIALLRELESFTAHQYELPSLVSIAVPDYDDYEIGWVYDFRVRVANFELIAFSGKQSWGVMLFGEQHLIGDGQGHHSEVLESLKVMAHAISNQFFGNLWVNCRLTIQSSPLDSVIKACRVIGGARFGCTKDLLLDKMDAALAMRDHFNIQKLQKTLLLDSFDSTSRPMTLDVDSPAEIVGLFDAIAYDKCELLQWLGFW